jgi:hypothetical protein
MNEQNCLSELVLAVEGLRFCVQALNDAYNHPVMHKTISECLEHVEYSLNEVREEIQ